MKLLLDCNGIKLKVKTPFPTDSSEFQGSFIVTLELEVKLEDNL